MSTGSTPEVGPFPHGVVCVLGMHRSGTSCLAGSLQRAGLSLGDHSTWNPFNQRGNRENPAINDLHDALLAANGGAWDDPPESLVWEPRHIERAREIIATYPQDRRWGFKDPKTLQAIDGWRALLGEMIQVGIFRHPVPVAQSLHHRNRVPLDRAFALWRHYNQRLLAEHDRRSFPLLSFDWDEETFHEKLNLVLPGLGLQPLGDSEEDRFFARELRHHEGPAIGGKVIALPPEVERMYRQLEERTV
jgi:hypothetical protein